MILIWGGGATPPPDNNKEQIANQSSMHKSITLNATVTTNSTGMDRITLSKCLEKSKQSIH